MGGCDNIQSIREIIEQVRSVLDQWIKWLGHVSFGSGQVSDGFVLPWPVEDDTGLVLVIVKHLSADPMAKTTSFTINSSKMAI